MTGRRTFIKQLTAAGMTGCIPGTLTSQLVAAGALEKTSANHSEKIRACFMHLSFNFAGGIMQWGGLRTEFEPDQSVWDEAIRRMADQGINMVLMNLDDSVLWKSHPEIALRNSWTPEKLRDELEKIRKSGIEPIPVLNFATTHDAWLGKYSKMVSTGTYYKVCRDLIAEAIDIFDKPRFIHFGMDEETYHYQKHFDHIVIRQNDLWWGDLYFYFSEALIRGVRPWIWSDYVWDNPDKFFKMMPKSAVQSNWFYGETLDKTRKQVKAYIDIEAEGYDQIPTGSYHADNGESILNTVRFCSEYIHDKRLMGFLQTFWKPCIEEYRDRILTGIELMGNAKRWFGKIPDNNGINRG